MELEEEEWRGVGGQRVEVAWYVINNPLIPGSLATSSLCCVTAVFLIIYLVGGLFPSKQEHILHELTADVLGKQTWHSLALPRHAARPMFRAASLLADGFWEEHSDKDCVSSFSKLVTESSVSQHFFSHVLQMVKSSKSHFRHFLVCEKREDLGRNNNGWGKKGHAWINGRCIQKWGDFKHSLNSSKNDTWHRRQTNFQRSSIKGSWEETTERITVSLLSSRTQCCSQWW